jgi:hypothetical protein
VEDDMLWKLVQSAVRQAGSSSSVAAIPGAGSLYWGAAAAAAVDATLSDQGGSNIRSSSNNHISTTAGNGVLDFKYLAHHMPAVCYDGLLRMLNSTSEGLDNSTLAALQLPLCAISTRCAAALRQAPSTRCNTCGAAETCGTYWGLPAGTKCDNRHPLWSGNLCYNSYFAPGLVGLLGLFGSQQQQQQAISLQLSQQR